MNWNRVLHIGLVAVSVAGPILDTVAHVVPGATWVGIAAGLAANVRVALTGVQNTPKSPQ